MKILIVEDDFTSRRLLQEFLKPYGQCDIAVHGKEAVRAFKQAWIEKEPYNLICLDIMMPELDGQDTLKQIRAFEKERGISGPHEVKVIMTTALDTPRDVIEAFYRGGCTSYLVKPIDRKALDRELKSYCS